MTWEAPERTPPTPEYWDDTYNADWGKWTEPKPDIRARVNEAVLMMHPLKSDMRVLDLGGGPLLGATLEKAGVYHRLVDHSQACCDLARKIAPKTDAQAADVREFLQSNKEQFDITVALGILAYLRPEARDELFELAPSPALVINEPICEGYLKYQTRVSIHSLKEYLESAVKYGWILTRRTSTMEHLFARFEKRKP